MSRFSQPFNKIFSNLSKPGFRKGVPHQNMKGTQQYKLGDIPTSNTPKGIPYKRHLEDNYFLQSGADEGLSDSWLTRWGQKINAS